jgi:cobalt-zinc-cadmium efflux system protein
MHVLMEGTPQGIDIRALEKTISETPGVESVHDLHVWSLAPGEPMLTAHVVLGAGAHGTDVASRVGQRIRAAHAIDHVTIQPEAPAQTELMRIRLRRQPPSSSG